MKHYLLFVSLIFAAVSTAEFIRNPDANTLWIENGKNIATTTVNSGPGWNNAELEIASENDSGFSIRAEDLKKYKSGRYVPVSREYPYLVYEIDGIEHTNNYKGYNIWFQGGIPYGAVSNPQKGIFVFNIYERSKVAATGNSFLRIDLYGLKLNFKYIKAVKKPDYYIVTESAAFAEKQYFEQGDKVKFTVQMKKPAEDVTLRFFDSYQMLPLMLNNVDKLQLKPLDEEGGIWSTEVTIDSLNRSRGSSPKGSILIKAVILGGGTGEPVWMYLAYPFGKKK